MASDQRDMSKLSAVKGVTSWIGGKSGAIVVMVLRGEDHAFWVDDRCTPADAAAAVELVLPEMIVSLNAERAEKKAKAIAKKQAELEKQLKEKR